MKLNEMISSKELQGIKLRLDAGDHQREIAKTFDRALSMVWRVQKAIREGTFNDWVAKAENREKTGKAFSPRKRPNEASTDARQAKALELQKQGLSIKEIAKKMGSSPGSINYYLYIRNKNAKEITSNGATRNGSGPESNGTINKNVLIGIAYSETERFVGLLGERLGLSTDLLRSRLSELLGHSPLR